MRIFLAILYGSASVLLGVTVAGCSRASGGSSPLPANLPNAGASALNTSQRSSPSVARRPQAVAYKQLYAFKGKPDGANPHARLIARKGVLYGTTPSGGLNDNGTVFAVSTSGTERTLYSFYGRLNDGRYPQAGLFAVNGTLYGTTYQGGRVYNCSYYGCGTVFAVSTSGKERLVYGFKGAGDGVNPLGGVIAMNGVLYGTTRVGGAVGVGTVFAVSTSGTERVLYSFTDGTGDGEYPYAGLVAMNGRLYGTTYWGGNTSYPNCQGYYFYFGCGTVFSVTTSGTERVLYRFKGVLDGSNPQAGLIVVNGALYGTTASGGAGTCGSAGCGTIFEWNTSGKERVLYRFTGSPMDGAYPQAGLVAMNGVLYGTTSGGGASGDGTVFAVSTSGTERVLYSFKGGADGANPNADLIAVNGTLYGTTSSGGGTGCLNSAGCGTVFELTPPGP